MGPEWLATRPGRRSRRPDCNHTFYSPANSNKQVQGARSGQQDNHRSSEQSPRIPVAVMMPPAPGSGPRTGRVSDDPQARCPASSKRHRSNSPTDQRQTKIARKNSIPYNVSVTTSTASDQEQTWHTPPPPPSSPQDSSSMVVSSETGSRKSTAVPTKASSLLCSFLAILCNGIDSFRATSHTTMELVQEQGQQKGFNDLRTDGLYSERARILQELLDTQRQTFQTREIEVLSRVHSMIDDRAGATITQLREDFELALKASEAALAEDKLEINTKIDTIRADAAAATKLACDAMQRAVDMKLAENDREVQAALKKCERITRTGEAKMELLETELTSTQKQVSQLEGDLQQSRSETSSAKDDLAEVTAKAEVLTSEANALRDELAKQKKLVSEARSDLDEVEKTLQQAQERHARDRRTQDRRHGETTATIESAINGLKEASAKAHAISDSVSLLDGSVSGLRECSAHFVNRSEIDERITALKAGLDDQAKTYSQQEEVVSRFAKLETELAKTTGIAKASTTTACVAQHLAQQTETALQMLTGEQPALTRAEFNETVQGLEKLMKDKNILMLARCNALKDLHNNLAHYLNTAVIGSLQVHWAVLQKATSREIIDLALATTQRQHPAGTQARSTVLDPVYRPGITGTQPLTPQSTPTQAVPSSTQLDTALPVLHRRSLG